MEYYVTFLLVCYVVDVVRSYTIKNIFKLEIGFKGICFLQILSIILSSIYLFLQIKFYQFILIKLIVDFIIVLLMVDNYKILEVIKTYLLSIIIACSYYGFYKFMTLLTRVLVYDVFNIKISKISDIFILFALICYIFAVFAVINFLSKKKILKTYLRKVSFLAFGKHIEIVGLLDTGNVLYDNKTHLPVIMVSTYSLKKYLPDNIYKNITFNNFSVLKNVRFIKMVTVANKVVDVPVIETNHVTISDGENLKTEKCVIGIVGHNFESGNAYDCLLHRDFV